MAYISVMEKRRYNLHLSAKLDAELTAIADDLGISNTDAIRRALGLLKVAHQAHKDGKSLAIVNEQGRLVAGIVGLN